MPIDDTDRRLISLLRRDARLSVAALAHKLGVSRGTVSSRCGQDDQAGNADRGASLISSTPWLPHRRHIAQPLPLYSSAP